MKKRLRLLLLAVGVFVGVGVAVLRPVPPKPGLTVENFRRLHQGMTEDEVEAILGQHCMASGEGWSLTLYWLTEHGHAEVDFPLSHTEEVGAESGQLSLDGCQVVSLPPKLPSFWERLRRLLPG